ncbi:MAG TPA: ATP-binding cassette domain-containing protein [Kofleriaceae bacterium]|nr:ATP-binding cassette domain-containing protein [Kofleriaceae bacterium]
MAGTALRLDEVTKRYGEFTAVDRLSLEIPAGTIWGILGPNGAGKTTTLRMVNDILAPDQGRIEVLDGLAPGRDAARRIGYLPEERGLYPKMRVAAALTFFGELRGLTGREARRRAGAWLDRLELARWARNKVQDLSKGMQQKVQFAAALIHEPELLVLDEPWSGLDPINAEVLRTMVAEQKAAGRSVIFSTHGMEQAEQICDGVTIIARGRKVLDGRLAAIRREASTGRRVALGFAGAPAAAAAEAVLADAALVRDRRVRRDHLEVELADGAGADALLAALVAAGVGLRRFEVVEPSLHQIFVDRVGQERA